jgi:DNA topoisomerase-1
VNDYLRQVTGEDYTAKDFRTWAGTVLAAVALREFDQFDSQTQAKKNVAQAIQSVAEKLRNTPSVCRKCYVHPAILEAYLDGTTLQVLGERAAGDLATSLHDLQPEEAAVLAMLEERLARAQEPVTSLLSKSIKAVRRRAKA